MRYTRGKAFKMTRIIIIKKAISSNNLYDCSANANWEGTTKDFNLPYEEWSN